MFLKGWQYGRDDRINIITYGRQDWQRGFTRRGEHPPIWERSSEPSTSDQRVTIEFGHPFARLWKATHAGIWLLPTIVAENQDRVADPRMRRLWIPSSPGIEQRKENLTNRCSSRLEFRLLQGASAD